MAGKKGKRTRSGTSCKSPTQNPTLKKLKQQVNDSVSDTESVYIDAEDLSDLSDSEFDPVSSEKMASSKNVNIADDLKGALISALKDPEVVNLLIDTLRTEIKNTVQSEIAELKTIITNKDTQIRELESKLKDSTEELEIYGRRNGVRIHGIPEVSGENTDEIVLGIASDIGAEIPDFALGRSHRVGPKVDQRPRPIIAKFIGHNYKVRLMRNKGKLRGSTPQIFINEDLTKTRADIAKRARKLKKDGKISDTWTRDGLIFVKYKDGKIDKVVKERELVQIENSFSLVVTLPKPNTSSSSQNV